MTAVTADDIFKLIFLNENGWIPIQISLKFAPRNPIDNKPALVQVMAWSRTGHSGLVTPYLWVNIDSCNGLLPDNTSPLHGPMLSYDQ